MKTKLLTSSREFRAALDLAHAAGREGKVARYLASVKVLHARLTARGHLPLEQGGQVECPRCSRSGSHAIETVNGKETLVMYGEIFSAECKS